MRISKGRLWKILALAGMMAVFLALTGCVVPPDDIDANSGYVVNNNDLPFQSLGPAITNTPYIPQAATATPTTVPTRNPIVTQVTATPTVNPSMIGVNGGQQGIVSVTPQIITPAPVSANPSSSSGSSLKVGSTGSEVKKLQQRLKDLGYLKGGVDGDFGAATETAVKNFQANNGLEVDGKAGPATLTKVYSSSARKAPSTTKTNTPRPTNTPFTSLKNGSTGDDVRRLQNRLKELGYLKGNVDGDFGDATEAAVRAFQARNGLTADGKAGTNTLNKLYSSSAKKATAAPTATAKPTKTPKPTAKPTAKPTNTPKPTKTPNVDDLDYYLQQGSSGTKVRTLQKRLIELGWLEGTADGSYGHATEYAVKAFQARYSSLWVDGVAGPDTLRTLYGAGAATTKIPAASLGISLEQGDDNDAVKAMQKRLKELGFYKTTADGEFGAATKSAVIAFQKANGISATGIATKATLNKLYSASAKDADDLKDEEDAKNEEDVEEDNKNQAPEDTDDVTVGGYTTLKWGSTGPEVKKLQQALKNRGYYSGKIDSTFGSGVYAAIKAFQKQYGLKVDGVAGPATQILLYGSTESNAWWFADRGDGQKYRDALDWGLLGFGYDPEAEVGILGVKSQPYVAKAQYAYFETYDDSPQWTTGEYFKSVEGLAEVTEEEVVDEAKYKEQYHMADIYTLERCCLYAVDCLCLSKMAGVLGYSQESQEYEKKYRQMAERINEKMWCEEDGCYYNLKFDGTFSKKQAPDCFMPLMTGLVPEERKTRLLAILQDEKKFWGEYMIPSIAKDDPAFPEQLYWRGQIWPTQTLWTYLALKGAGEDVLAWEFALKAADMLAREWRENGYAPENYNAYTGRCSGSPHYNWGVLMGLPFLEELVEFKEDTVIFGNVYAEDGLELSNILVDGHRYNMQITQGMTTVWRDGKKVAEGPGRVAIAR